MTKLIFCLLFFASTARAGVYLEHTRNENLKTELGLKSQRLIPETELFTFAVDTYLFKPWGLGGTYYHGNGYWVNIFSEARPHKDVVLNLKVVPYNGASSYGYAVSNHLQSFFGLSWDPSFVDGLDIHFRFGDLDRETFGAGLLLQEKEINGLRIRLGRDDFRYTGIIDGTGSFYYAGDMYYQAIDWRKNLVGASFTFINYDGNASGELNGNDGSTRIVNQWGKPGVTIFSKQNFATDWNYGAEVGYRNKTTAAMAQLFWQKNLNEKFRLKVGIDGRFYNRGFADEIAGYVEQEYITPETLDKPATDPRNIFRFDDDVIVYAAFLGFDYRPTWWLELASSNEGLSFDYKANGTMPAYFSKHAAKICPYRERPQDCLSFFASTKALRQLGPVSTPSNGPVSYAMKFHYGIEAFVYF